MCIQRHELIGKRKRQHANAPHVNQGDVQVAVLEVRDETARVRRAQRDPGVAVYMMVGMMMIMVD